MLWHFNQLEEERQSACSMTRLPLQAIGCLPWLDDNNGAGRRIAVKRRCTAGKFDSLGLADDNFLHWNSPLPAKAITKTAKYNELFKFELLIMYLLLSSIIMVILTVKSNCIYFTINKEIETYNVWLLDEKWHRGFNLQYIAHTASLRMR